MLNRIARLAIVILCTTPALAGFTPNLTTERVASGLELPTTIAHAPGDFDRIFVLEKPGGIRIVDISVDPPQLLGPFFLDLDTQITGGTNSFDERGLLGMAFHPDYANNGFFYLYYTSNVCSGSSCDVRVSRFSVSAGNPNLADSGSEVILMTIDQPQSNHNGGWIGFGPNDGYLYIATGDGGGGCDSGSGHSTGGNAQDITSNLLGKILRIDVDGTNGPGGDYGIPADNPLVGVSGDDEIWAYGLRNPWRCGFDRETGDLYIGDVGQFVVEEVDFQPASSSGGENYGWRCMEGDSCSSVSGCATSGCTCGSAALTDPLHTYTHADGNCAVSGGVVYRGCAINGLRGTYLFGDACGGTIWSFQVVNGNLTNFQSAALSALNPPGQSINSVVGFGEDAYGEIYLVDHNTGEIYRFLADSPLNPDDDCDASGVHDACEILDGTSADFNMNGIPDLCEPPCLDDADCADANGDFVRDDACTDYTCSAGSCIASARATQADIGGGNGACPLDGVCDSNDNFHALNCFSNQTTTGTPGYACEPAAPSALRVDAGSPFGICSLDGICDAGDAFHALTCFSDVDSAGNAGYPCNCSGPAPQSPQQPRTVAQADLVLRGPRSAPPGSLIDVHVLLGSDVRRLQGYQLHLGTRGGTSGQLQLQDISIQKDAALSGHSAWTAFNAETSQMLAGLSSRGLPARAGAYLGTFSYRVPDDAAGVFEVDVLFDDKAAGPLRRTFLFASPTDKIGIRSTAPARIIVRR